MIYLDYAATSPMSRPVLEAMWPYLTDDFGNASSHHEAGQRALVGLEDARSQVAAVMNCRPDEIVFTSGGTESNNYAIKGAALAKPGARSIVTTPLEHEAVSEPLRYLERLHGVRTEIVGVDSDGLVELEALSSALTADTTLVTIQYANSEIGTVQPLAEISRICHSAGVTLHTDAVQAAGSLSLDVQALGVDMLSISGHKFGGPKGIGALFVRRGIRLEPLMHGGGQERGARSGTSNVAGAVGLATALTQTARAVAGPPGTTARSSPDDAVRAMRDRFIDGVLADLPDARLTGHRTLRLANHASFTLGTVSGESIVVELAVHAISCSSGSACAEGQDEASPTLVAIGIAAEVAQTAVRFTLGPDTTDAELEEARRQLVIAVRSLSN